MTKKRVMIGIPPGSEGQRGWIRLLEQERHAFVEAADLEADILLFSDELPPWIESYVSRGGIAIVSGAPDADGILPTALTSLVHRFLSPVDSRTPVEAPGLARLYAGPGFGTCRVHENRIVKGGVDPDIYPVVKEAGWGRGILLYTGIALTRLLVAAGDSLRPFSANTVTERVSSIDKAGVLDTLLWMLRRAFFRLGFPYARVARFPEGASSVFILRIDVDGVFGSNAQTISECAADAGIRASFFFNGSLCDTIPGSLDDWPRLHEIGHHGYVHNVFESVDENLRNLRRGADWVRRKIGVAPAGFVAPRGLWNEALERALIELGYGYSSDFAIDFDSLPFRSRLGLLQIPVHPYSPERAVAHAAECGLSRPTPTSIARHYVDVITEQTRQQRPAYIYGHPEILGEQASDILPAVFERVRDAHIPNLSLGDFATWWEQREQVSLLLERDEATGTFGVVVEGERDAYVDLLDHPSLRLELGRASGHLDAAPRSTVLVQPAHGAKG